MKKKLLSIVLMLVMVLSLAGCNNQLAAKPTAKSVLETISNAEQNTISYEMDIEASGMFLSLKFDGVMKDEANAYVNVLAKLSYDTYVIEEYCELTNIYVINNEMIYIDVQQVLDFLVELDSQFAMLSTYFELPGEYLAFTPEDIVELYEELEIDTSELNLESMSMSMEANEEYNARALDILGSFLDEYVEKTGGTSTNVEKNKISIKINNDNIGTIVKGLAEMDIEGYLSDILELSADMQGGMTADFNAAKSELSGINAQMKQAAENFETVSSEMGDVDIAFEMGVEGTNTTMNMSMNVDGLKFNLIYSATPEFATEFSIPANTMTMDEFIQMFYDYGLM